MSFGGTTIGPGSTVERVLSDYGLGPESAPEDLVESDTDRLLLALLLEQRGVDNISDAVVDASDDTPATAGTNTPSYLSGSVTATADPKEIELDFNASTVVFRSFDNPIFAAFRQPSGPTDKIQMDPSNGDEPFVVSPGSDFTTASIWIGRPESSQDTSLIVEAFE